MRRPLLAPFVTHRSTGGMVATVDQLASVAGAGVLGDGGTAVDAAIAANAVLAVTTQHMCGLGGDLWALVHEPGRTPTALDASGAAGSGADPERLRAEGFTSMPQWDDIRATPVPGCVDGWQALHDRYGRLEMSRVLEPAIHLAENGFPAGMTLCALLPRVAGKPGTGDYPSDGSLRPGDVVRRPGVARTLRAVAAEGRDAFYGGEFGSGLIDLGDGEFTAEDLAAVQARWVEPLSVVAWDHRVWTTPPASQGYLSLLAAAIASGLERPAVPADPDDPLWAHLLIEAAKQAGRDRPEVLHQDADGAALLAGDRINQLRSRIRADRAADLSGPGGEGDTIYLCTVDGSGMGVSLIQSNASGWGSGLVEPNTRIFLHNRGQGFNLTPGHGAEYGPGRRPPHTLAPALVTTPDGGLRAVLGTMGGDSQPQVVLQMLARLLHGNEDPARVVAAGRWRLASAADGGFDTWSDPGSIVVQVEANAPEWARALRDRGHTVVERPAFDSSFGHAHLIEVAANGVRAGASDPRALGGAALGM